MTELERLRYENECLRARMEELIGSASEKDRMRRTLGITPQQAQILLLLSMRDTVSHDIIYRNVFEDDTGDGPMEPIAKVQISGLRKKLRQKGAPEGIKNMWGWGYTITPELKSWVREKMN